MKKNDVNVTVTAVTIKERGDNMTQKNENPELVQDVLSDEEALELAPILPGFPSAGSKRDEAVALNHAAEEAVRTYGIDEIDDYYTGGFAVIANLCVLQVSKFFANDADTGIIILANVGKKVPISKIIEHTYYLFSDWFRRLTCQDLTEALKDKADKADKATEEVSDDLKETDEVSEELNESDSTEVLGDKANKADKVTEEVSNGLKATYKVLAKLNEGISDVVTDIESGISEDLKLDVAAIALIRIYGSVNASRRGVCDENLIKFLRCIRDFCEAESKKDFVCNSRRLLNIFATFAALRKANVKTASRDAMEILKELQQEAKKHLYVNAKKLLILDPPYVKSEKFYSKEFPYSLHMPMLLRAYATGARFIVCFDEEALHVYAFMQIFPDVHVYFVHKRDKTKDDEGKCEYIMTNFPVSEISVEDAASMGMKHPLKERRIDTSRIPKEDVVEAMEENMQISEDMGLDTRNMSKKAVLRAVEEYLENSKIVDFDAVLFS